MDKQEWMRAHRALHTTSSQLTAELRNITSKLQLSGLNSTGTAAQQHSSSVFATVADAKQQLSALQTQIIQSQQPGPLPLPASFIQDLAAQISKITELLSSLKSQQRQQYSSLLRQEQQLQDEVAALQLKWDDSSGQDELQHGSNGRCLQLLAAPYCCSSLGAMSECDTDSTRTMQPRRRSATASCVDRSTVQPAARPATAGADGNTRHIHQQAGTSDHAHSRSGSVKAATHVSNSNSSSVCGSTLLPEVVAHDEFLARYGAAGGWHTDDHNVFLAVLRRSRVTTDGGQQFATHATWRVNYMAQAQLFDRPKPQEPGHSNNSKMQKKNWSPHKGGVQKRQKRQVNSSTKCFKGDYSAALTAAVEALPGMTRQQVIAHSRWHADLTELDMRRHVALVNWRAARDAAKAARQAEAAILQDAHASAQTQQQPPDQLDKESRQLRKHIVAQWKAERAAAEQQQAAMMAEQQRRQRECEQAQLQHKRASLKKQLEAAKAAKQQAAAANPRAQATTAQVSASATAADLIQQQEVQRRLSERNSAAMNRRRQLLFAKQDKLDAREKAQRQLLAEIEDAKPRVSRDPGRLLSATAAVAARAAQDAEEAAGKQAEAGAVGRGSIGSGFVLHLGHKAVPSWASGMRS